jgi:hypothetical protein
MLKQQESIANNEIKPKIKIKTTSNGTLIAPFSSIQLSNTFSICSSFTAFVWTESAYAKIEKQ